MINSGLLAGIIFIIMYVFIASEKINRTVVAMLGSLLMVLTGIITQEKAIHHIDFNTLGLLIGMMIIVAITGQTGVFNYIAIYAAKVAKGEPKRILIILALITAVCSAFLDNVTTVLLIVPVTISITKKLKVDPIPFLITQIIASNIGGTATLIGDPPNIMIGSAVKELTFLAFIQNLAPIAVINLIVVVGILSFLYRKKLMAQDSLKAEIMKLEPEAEIKDRRLLKKSLGILMLTLLGFFMHQSLNLESSTIALTGGFLLLATVGKKHNFIESVLEKIEWGTIFFFIGLFIAVGALIETGIIKQIALYCFEITKGEVLETSLLVLWLSAIISAFLDNIPFVATMIPLIFDMGNMGIVNLEPIWWSLALGACLGGNGTIIGASANLIVAAMAAEKGHNISFVKYLKVGFPVMLLTILISTSYVYLRFLN
ncbi:MAG: ArsB/NhaD family transporter [Negativicutes bacterium]|nr:ArsB/NhaD family transporter [Negativicutes bacterium]MBP8628631.1 ArsB/NhaD family transporter [Negativicutes bacterium]MBP9536766.1 ArsB/NhaD family transporter [Negativicutes bacterium]MBP9949080.1 ArsB/NhaD family transporter [Negativicutes bacterium]